MAEVYLRSVMPLPELPGLTPTRGFVTLKPCHCPRAEPDRFRICKACRGAVLTARERQPDEA